MLDPKNFDEEIKSEQTTLVEFYADWCQPCKMMAPILELLSDKYRVMKVNVDEFPAATSNNNISSVPTLVFFKNGKSEKKMVGLQRKETLVSIFEDLEK